jgi:thioredoxin-like negative regulator of GroEL
MGGRGPMARGMGGGGDGDGGAMDPRFRQLEMLRGYLDAVGGYARLAHDPSTTGIAAVVAAADILRPRGTDAAIDYFNKLLPDTKNPAVQRAIRMHLVDFYKAAGQQDKALEQIRILVTADMPNEPAASTPPAGNPPPR